MSKTRNSPSCCAKLICKMENCHRGMNLKPTSVQLVRWTTIKENLVWMMKVTQRLKTEWTENLCYSDVIWKRKSLPCWYTDLPPSHRIAILKSSRSQDPMSESKSNTSVSYPLLPRLKITPVGTVTQNRPHCKDRLLTSFLTVPAHMKSRPKFRILTNVSSVCLHWRFTLNI